MEGVFSTECDMGLKIMKMRILIQNEVSMIVSGTLFCIRTGRECLSSMEGERIRIW